MKKLATLLVAGAVVLLYACGPSAKEKKQKELLTHTRADSMAKFRWNKKSG